MHKLLGIKYPTKLHHQSSQRKSVDGMEEQEPRHNSEKLNDTPQTLAVTFFLPTLARFDGFFGRSILCRAATEARWIGQFNFRTAAKAF
jgi:hypothetical protein